VKALRIREFVRLAALVVVLLAASGCRATAESGDGRDASADVDNEDVVGTEDVFDDTEQDVSDADGASDADPSDASDADSGQNQPDSASDATDEDTDGDSPDASDGCPSGEHDGGDGTCVPEGECSDGFHDGGEGDCVLETRCSTNFYLSEAGTCEPVGSDVVQVDASQTAEWVSSDHGKFMVLGVDYLFTFPYRISLADGSVDDLQISDHVKYRRMSAWISGGRTRMLIGRYQGTGGYSVDGDREWGCCGGCCDYFNKDVPAIHTAQGVGYLKRGSVFSYMLTNGHKGPFNAEIAGGKGYTLIDGTNIWSAAKGYVGRSSTLTGLDVWEKPVDTPTTDAPLLASSALMFDGSLVTASRSGFVTRVAPDATSPWDNDPSIQGFSSEDVTHGVVIGPDHVFVNTAAPGIAAFDKNDGTEAWRRTLGGTVHDHVVGEGGYLYAYIPSTGTLVALDTATGDTRIEYSSVPGGTTVSNEILLRDGILYVHGGNALMALPVPSTRYDPQAAWPTRFHDNQNTSDLWGPMTY
jgi:hypothetical protein